MREDGGDIALAFTSTGSGKVVASTAVGSAGDQGVSEMLDDTTYATSADTNAAGTADATVVNLSFTSEDVIPLPFQMVRAQQSWILLQVMTAPPMVT